MLGLTEEQLWDMTPRSFHNLLKGRMRKEKAKQEVEDLRHRELVLAIFSPHMKKSDRDRAYDELYARVEKGKPKKKKEQKDPVKFWEDIDKRTRQAKEPPIPEG